MKQALSGGRGQQRLADLHRSVSEAVQSLHQHQLALVTALRSADAASQQSMLEEHRARVNTAMRELASLGAFIDRCRTMNVPDTTRDIQQAS